MRLKNIVVFFVIFFVGLGLAFVLQQKILAKRDASAILRFQSPLPSFLALLTNKQVITLDLWRPSEVPVLGAWAKVPQIEAEAALSYDITTNKLLYARNENKEHPMASLTKVMTAIIGLENQRPDDRYVVKKEALVGEDSMGLESGEVLHLGDLLYGIFLHSANDAAETIAINYPQGRVAFIQAMNDKAKALGLEHTHFTNPTGLEGDGDQHTTAHDLLVITKYGLTRSPLFRQVAATVDYQIAQTAYHKEYDLENETNLLTSYPGVKGIKTGYTPEAGLCLITYLEYQGHDIVAVVLNSNNRRQDMKDLLDYSLKLQGVPPPKHT